MAFNGNIRTALVIVSAVLSAGGVAVGYGSLKADVKNSHDDISRLREEVREAKTNIGASAAGASLVAQINEINRRLDRLEAQNTEILRILTRIGRP